MSAVAYEAGSFAIDGGELSQRVNQHIAFSKKAVNYQEKAEIFNQGLKEIRDSGELKAIIAKHRYEGLVSYVGENN